MALFSQGVPIEIIVGIKSFLPKGRYEGHITVSATIIVQFWFKMKGWKKILGSVCS